MGGVGGANVARGRFALAPDNDWHSVRGELALVLPWQGRWVTTASWSRARQDDELVPPTVNAGVVGTPGLNGLDLAQWNTRSALPRSRADAEVDSLLLVSRLHLRPWNPLRIGFGVRYDDRDNRTRYSARNPTTGQIGYVALDGALNARTPFSRVFVPGALLGVENFRYRSSAYDRSALQTELTADLRLEPKTSLGLRARRQEIRREDRERDETREHSLRVSLSTRRFAPMTLLATYDYADRDGDEYESFPVGDRYVSSLPGYTAPFGFDPPPFTLAELRKSDLADRRRHEGKLHVNFLLAEALDLALSARLRDDDFGSDYGLREDRSASAGLDIGYQPSPSAQAWLFANLERSRRTLAGINDLPVFPPSSDPDAGGAVFPLEASWKMETAETSTGVGAGFRWRAHERLILEVDLHRVSTRGRRDFAIGGPAALTVGLVEAQALPDLRTRDLRLGASARIELAELLAVRLLYRYERGVIADFHQQGLDRGPVLTGSGALFLGHVDRDYAAHLFALTLQARFPR